MSSFIYFSNKSFMTFEPFIFLKQGNRESDIPQNTLLDIKQNISNQMKFKMVRRIRFFLLYFFIIL